MIRVVQAWCVHQRHFANCALFKATSDRFEGFVALKINAMVYA